MNNEYTNWNGERNVFLCDREAWEPVGHVLSIIVVVRTSLISVVLALLHES